MNAHAKSIADKYVARDGSSPSADKGTVIWAPVRLLEKERAWLEKSILRTGHIPTKERDGETAPHLSELRAMHARGLITGLPWRITRFGRECLREIEGQRRAEPKIVPVPSHATAPSNWAIRPLSEVERDAIENAIAVCAGNRTHAARALGISVRTIRNKLKRFETHLNGV